MRASDRSDSGLGPGADNCTGALALLPLPLFPLRTVLFPGGLLHLKVFEARYLDMVSERLRARQPFGVVCLKDGSDETERNMHAAQLESTGVLARIDDVDAEHAGILRLRCTAVDRFRLLQPPQQQSDGLWLAPATEVIAPDAAHVPAPAMLATVDALAEAIRSLQRQGKLPFAEPFRLDDAGWVANRWCELLPVSLAAKQKLMALEDPVIRLSLVDGFLRDKKVIVG